MSEPTVVETFTGDHLLYNPETHKYTTLKGEPLLSGSKYAEEFAKPFDRERLLALTAKKLNQPIEVVEAAWEIRGAMSRELGTAFHRALEGWFKYRGIGYGVSHNPFLAQVVESFPLKDAEAYAEIMVSDLRLGLVGQIDLLVVTGEKRGFIVDYKSDAKVEKNLVKHFNQLSFYAHILIAAGWTIEKVVVYNYIGTWTPYESPVLPLQLGV